jgi:hypothetical protein
MTCGGVDLVGPTNQDGYVPLEDDGTFTTSVRLGRLEDPYFECTPGDEACPAIAVDSSWTFTLAASAETWAVGPSSPRFGPPPFSAPPVVLGFMP